MVTLRWHSSPAPAHMATRFSARSEGGGWVGGQGDVFFGSYPARAITASPGAWRPLDAGTGTEVTGDMSG